MYLYIICYTTITRLSSSLGIRKAQSPSMLSYGEGNTLFSLMLMDFTPSTFLRKRKETHRRYKIPGLCMLMIKRNYPVCII